MNSRLFAAQEMIALQKGDAGHENETYSAYRARCISQGNVFKNLLPAGPTFVTELVAQGKAMPSDIGFMSSRFSEGCFGTCKTIGLKEVHLITNNLAVRRR